ncbi:MAG: tetratricopeptide repeat protein [Nitrospiraceae bacterium]|nr:tetratricopeptide repeat protein [Nitrospiraceae bacterium]
MNSTLQELYDLGKKLFDEGKFSEAEPLLREIVKINPNYADVQNKLGVISNLKGDLKAAAEHFEKALQINPRYTEASLNLAVTYNDLGEFKLAQDVFSMAAQIAHPDPNVLDPFIAGKLANEHFKLGNLYLEFNMNEEAITEYRKAVRLHPKLADVHTKLGIALRNKGKNEEAIVHFVKAKAINPKYGAAWVQLGLSYYMEGLTGLAFEEWEKALAAIPNLKEAANYLKLLKKEEK